jgi:hypothetical protein
MADIASARSSAGNLYLTRTAQWAWLTDDAGFRADGPSTTIGSASTGLAA